VHQAGDRDVIGRWRIINGRLVEYRGARKSGQETKLRGLWQWTSHIDDNAGREQVVSVIEY
jgi:hypothetical protein